MLILHDPATLLHKTKEILGGELIEALEKPARIEAIIKAIEADKVIDLDTSEPRPRHDLHIVDKNDVGSLKVKALLQKCMVDSHDGPYLEYIRTAFENWLINGNVKEDGCILPECFRPPPGTSGSGANEVPKDRFARAGYVRDTLSRRRAIRTE
jgi:hypothetical protein